MMSLNKCMSHIKTIFIWVSGGNRYFGNQKLYNQTYKALIYINSVTICKWHILRKNINPLCHITLFWLSYKIQNEEALGAELTGHTLIVNADMEMLLPKQTQLEPDATEKTTV